MPYTGRDLRGRLTGLEALRFVCALSILIFHYHQFSFEPERGFVLSPNRWLPFHEVLQVFYTKGSFAVPVFWCISGFIFFWKYQARIADHAVTFKKFVVLRFTRLYPLHLVTLVLVAGLQLLYSDRFGSYFVYQANDLFHFVLQLGMASNWYPAAPYSFNGPIWSVSLEVLVYLLFFVIAANVTRSWKFNVFVVLLAIALIRIPELLSIQQIIKCVGFFYGGGLSAAVYRKMLSEGLFDRKCIQFGVNFGILVGIALIAAGFLWLHRYFSDLTIEFMLLTVPLILLVLAQEIPVHQRILDLVDTAGNTTYASYLLHFPCQIAVVLLADKFGYAVSVYNPYLLLGFVFGTFSLALLVYRYFEAPVQRRLRALLISSSDRSVAAAT